MRNDFNSYLDAFNRITIIINKQLCMRQKTFCLVRDTDSEELYIESIEDIGKDFKYNCIIKEYVKLNKDYTIYDESQNRSRLRSGKIVRTALFEMMYAYEGNDLGFTYSKEKTTFKLWTPVAKEVEIELISPTNQIGFYDLTYTDHGVWEITLNEDLECFKYRYNIRVNDQFETINDPYGISSDANGYYNYVINLDKKYKFMKEKPSFSGNPVDAIIYEASVRDFSISPTSRAVHRGKYIGMAENHPGSNGLPTGLSYLEYLGITHLQLLPIFDFGGVDELNQTNEYNWGYNPEQYNVPEGSYAKNPNDPYSRINELCYLIDSAHANNIRVVMDVVFNHVYKIEEFPFDKLVPGYFYRVDQNELLTNVSGCGNDLATERKMARKFIIDSLVFWTKNYNISGFRFDLMGLLDIETMNQVYKTLKDIDSTMICYGEGWNMPNSLPESQRACMSNTKALSEIGFFNDKFRDAMRGNQWNHTLGYVNGGKHNIHELIALITGSCIDNYLFDNPNLTINYVECHDNYTFYDYTKKINPWLTEKTRIDYQALSLGIVLLSQGVPFIHAGQEFLRTKKGIENSYNIDDEINQIDWSRRDDNIELVLVLKDLIKLRKEIKEFRFTNKQQIVENISVIEKNDSSIVFRINSIENIYILIVKNDYQEESRKLDFTITEIFDGRLIKNDIINTIIINKPGVYLYKKEV